MTNKKITFLVLSLFALDILIVYLGFASYFGGFQYLTVTLFLSAIFAGAVVLEYTYSAIKIRFEERMSVSSEQYDDNYGDEDFDDWDDVGDYEE